MKVLLPVLCLVFGYTLQAQEHRLDKIWETDTIVAVPESVLIDYKKNVLYVSLIDGEPWMADGKGGIGRISSEGRKYDGNWITGLNAPKGMGILGDYLYVADMAEVVVIDLAKGVITKKIAVDGAQQLNDITVSNKGIIYVTDSKGFNVFRIEKDSATPYLQDMKGINGIKAVEGDLVIASGRDFVRVNSQKTVTLLATLPQGGDGIEPVGNGDFIVTSWIGYVYYVYANGKVETILDTKSMKKNAADIGYDRVKNILYVPTFFGKTVIAYRLVEI